MHKKVLVVGSGGVGAIAALALNLNKEVETTLVVRSDYDHVMKHGYKIQSVTYGNIENWKPRHVCRSVQEAQDVNGPFDYIVLTTKNIPDGYMSCEDIIKPAVAVGTVIVLVQNGIGIEVPMIEAFPGHVILSGISLIGSSNIDCVVSNLHKDFILLTPFINPSVDERVAYQKAEEFAAIYQNPDKLINQVVLEKDSRRSRWEKLVYNSVMNPISTLAGLDVTRCQINGCNETLFRPAMDEVAAIAKSDGVELGEESKEKFLHIGDGLFYSPSMLVDSRKKQLFELEVILGNPLRIAKKNGVATPILSVVYQLLKMKQFKLKEEKKIIKVDENQFKNRNSDDYPKIFAEHNK